MTPSCPKPPVALIAGLLLAAAARAFDMSDLPASARNKLALPELQSMEREDMAPFAPSLSTETIPFIGDFPIVDSQYVLGPGDILQIFHETTILEKQVNPEGNILLIRLGVVKVGGLTLKAARKSILDRLQGVYKKSECFVSLARPKTMKVFATGAVNAPGVYEVSGNSRLSDLLALSQGFAPTARRSEIRITSQDGTVRSVNLRRFYVDGDLEHNPYLPQGGFVQIPFLDYSQPWVTVRRDTLQLPVQIEPGENLDDLLHKFQGFRAPPPFSFIQVREADGRTRVMGPGESLTSVPGPGAQVEILPQFRNIYVGGAVARPGYQPYRSNRTVLQYISESGLITSSRISENIEVTRTGGKRERVNVKDGVLQPGDMVYVDQNNEQRFLLYTPILLSLASFSIAIITLMQ